MNQLMRYGAYPFVFVFGIALHDILLENHLGLQVATYLPVIVGAVMVAGLEWKYPYRQQWGADKQEMVQDAIFMALIQGIFPSCWLWRSCLLCRRLFTNMTSSLKDGGRHNGLFLCKCCSW